MICRIMYTYRTSDWQFSMPDLFQFSESPFKSPVATSSWGQRTYVRSN
jgi:hypothetical protein